MMLNDLFTHIALLVWLVGLAIWSICCLFGKWPDEKRMGEIMFGIGLLAWLLGK